MSESIYPLVNPKYFGPYRGNESNADDARWRDFNGLEAFLEKYPDSANQTYKVTYFWEDCSIICPCLLSRSEDIELRPLNAMLLYEFRYPMKASDYKNGIKLLVKNHADVNHTYRDLKPIQIIMTRRFDGIEDVIELFLAKGANINDKNSAGLTPLHILVTKHYVHSAQTPSLVKFLLRKGASINSQDNAGDTPLHVAVKAQDSDSILVLLNNNCDTSLLNKAALTALDLAKSINCNSVIITMLENPEAFIKPAERVIVETENQV